MGRDDLKCPLLQDLLFSSSFVKTVAVLWQLEMALLEDREEMA